MNEQSARELLISKLRNAYRYGYGDGLSGGAAQPKTRLQKRRANCTNVLRQMFPNVKNSYERANAWNHYRNALYGKIKGYDLGVLKAYHEYKDNRKRHMPCTALEYKSPEELKEQRRANLAAARAIRSAKSARRPRAEPRPRGRASAAEQLRRYVARRVPRRNIGPKALEDEEGGVLLDNYY